MPLSLLPSAMCSYWGGKEKRQHRFSRILGTEEKKEPNVPDTEFKIISGPLRDTFIHSTMHLSKVLYL